MQKCGFSGFDAVLWGGEECVLGRSELTSGLLPPVYQASSIEA